jgi:hypothetical protein
VLSLWNHIYDRTMKPYDTLKLKNALIKSALRHGIRHSYSCYYRLDSEHSQEPSGSMKGGRLLQSLKHYYLSEYSDARRSLRIFTCYYLKFIRVTVKKKIHQRKPTRPNYQDQPVNVVYTNNHSCFRSSEMLHSVGSCLPIGCPETSVNISVRCVTSRKSEDLIYTAAEV